MKNTSKIDENDYYISENDYFEKAKETHKRLHSKCSAESANSIKDLDLILN